MRWLQLRLRKLASFPIPLPGILARDPMSPVGCHWPLRLSASVRLRRQAVATPSTKKNVGMWSQKSDGNLPGSSRLGSGRSDRGSEQRNGPGQQYNAWDRAARPGSGRGAAGDRNSATSPGASVSSTSSPSLSPTSPSAGGGLVPEHRIRPGAFNLVPGRMCNTASCLTSPEQQERRQSLKISFSQPNILMKKSVSMGLNFPGFSQVSLEWFFLETWCLRILSGWGLVVVWKCNRPSAFIFSLCFYCEAHMDHNEVECLSLYYSWLNVSTK